MAAREWRCADEARETLAALVAQWKEVESVSPRLLAWLELVLQGAPRDAVVRLVSELGACSDEKGWPAVMLHGSWLRSLPSAPDRVLNTVVVPALHGDTPGGLSADRRALCSCNNQTFCWTLPSAPLCGDVSAALAAVSAMLRAHASIVESHLLELLAALPECTALDARMARRLHEAYAPARAADDALVSLYAPSQRALAMAAVAQRTDALRLCVWARLADAIAAVDDIDSRGLAPDAEDAPAPGGGAYERLAPSEEDACVPPPALDGALGDGGALAALLHRMRLALFIASDELRRGHAAAELGRALWALLLRRALDAALAPALARRVCVHGAEALGPVRLPCDTEPLIFREGLARWAVCLCGLRGRHRDRHGLCRCEAATVLGFIEVVAPTSETQGCANGLKLDAAVRALGVAARRLRPDGFLAGRDSVADIVALEAQAERDAGAADAPQWCANARVVYGFTDLFRLSVGCVAPHPGGPAASDRRPVVLQASQAVGEAAFVHVLVAALRAMTYDTCAGQDALELELGVEADDAREHAAATGASSAGTTAAQDRPELTEDAVWEHDIELCSSASASERSHEDAGGGQDAASVAPVDRDRITRWLDGTSG